MEHLQGLPEETKPLIDREAVLETERRCFSEVIMESNVTPYQ